MLVTTIVDRFWNFILHSNIDSHNSRASRGLPRRRRRNFKNRLIFSKVKAYKNCAKCLGHPVVGALTAAAEYVFMAGAHFWLVHVPAK